MRTRRFAHLSTLLAIATLLGCNEATSPGVAGPFEFTASVSPSTIRVGETATFTLQLRNTSSEALTLNFPSTCQIVPYVSKPNGTLVYPQGGGWGCGQALTQLRLEPGGIVVHSVDVQGGAIQPTIFTGPQLAPGNYRLWGELGVPPHTHGRTHSAELTVVE